MSSEVQHIYLFDIYLSIMFEQNVECRIHNIDLTSTTNVYLQTKNTPFKKPWCFKVMCFSFLHCFVFIQIKYVNTYIYKQNDF